MSRSRLLAAAIVLPFILGGCSRINTDWVCGCGAPTTGPAPGSEQDLVAKIGDRVFFTFNSAELGHNDQAAIEGPNALALNLSTSWWAHADRSSFALTILNRQVAWLVKYPSVKILIAGNTDERGTETYNLALGQHRADSTRDYLIANGVASNRIKTISYGQDRPVATGHNEDAWHQNRNAITSVQGFNPQAQ